MKGCLLSLLLVVPTIEAFTIHSPYALRPSRISVALQVSAKTEFGSLSAPQEEVTPLCDLQTLLRLASIGNVDTGGSAKVLIQSGKCQLNGGVETRRAKKLFPGDVVCFEGIDYHVNDIVRATNYVYKPKKKKKILENGGRYRSEEWRAQRKEKKSAKKSAKQNLKEEKWRAERNPEKEAQRLKQVQTGIQLTYLKYAAMVTPEMTSNQRLELFGKLWQRSYAQNCSAEKLPMKIDILKGLIALYKEQGGGSLSDTDQLIITGGKNPDDLRIAE